MERLFLWCMSLTVCRATDMTGQDITGIESC